MAARTLPGLLAEAAADSPNSEALVFGERRLTFAALHAEVRQFAAAALAVGVQPGDRAAVWAPNSDRWVVAALGLTSVGAILVPVNTRFKGEEAQHVLANTRASVLVVDNAFLGVDRAGQLAAEQPLPSLQHVVAMDDASWSAFLAEGADVSSEQVAAVAASVAPSDISDIIFTSGTTGRPKGAMVTHEQSVRVFQCWAETVGLTSSDRMLVVSPFFHTFGYKAGLLACLLQRATLLPVQVFDVEATLALVEAERASVIPGAPTLYASLLEHPRRTSYDLSSVRLAVTGASVVPTELIRRMREELGFDSVLTAYGLTESCGYATGCHTGDADEVVSLTSGRAIADVEVIVVDSEGTPVACGEPGEVLVRGYNVMVGYWEDPAATQAAIDKDGWLHTGDVGVLDEAGNLRITDRLKDMFVVGGFNAYPAEVEQVLVRHPAVAEAAVIGVADDRLGEVGKAFVVARTGTMPEPEALIEWCRERLAGYKVPRTVELVQALPRNATGKVDKKLLRG